MCLLLVSVNIVCYHVKTKRDSHQCFSKCFYELFIAFILFYYTKFESPFTKLYKIPFIIYTNYCSTCYMGKNLRYTKFLSELSDSLQLQFLGNVKKNGANFQILGYAPHLFVGDYVLSLILETNVLTIPYKGLIYIFLLTRSK